MSSMWNQGARGGGPGQSMYPGMGRGGHGGRMMHPGMGRGGRMGQGMQPGMGRGGRMGQGMQPGMGRGGRGGQRMQPGMGRGGRMGQGMYPGIGRGGRGGQGMQPGMGRGGRGQMMAGWGGGPGLGPAGKKIPCKLDVFNRYVGYKISSFMEREEQEFLGIAFPQFTPGPLTEEQQKKLMMRKQFKKMMEDREKNKQIKNTTTENDSENEADENESEPCFLGALGRNTVKDSKEDADVTADDPISDKVAPDVTEVSSEDDTSEEGSTDAKDNSTDPKEVETLVSDEAVDKCLHDVCLEEGKTCGKTEDESKTACKLDIDLYENDETIPPPDTFCPCEPCVKALNKADGKETCKCSSCRLHHIKAVQDCECERCNALTLKLADAPDFSQVDCKCDECAKNPSKPDKTKEMMKQREEQIRSNLTDCDTLLAQLNTKRLYRRIKYFKRKDPEYDVDKAYPYHKDTVDISELEWDALIEDYKQRHAKIFAEKNIKEKEEAEKRARAKAKRAKKYKKNGGKGKKPQKSEEETKDVTPGEGKIEEEEKKDHAEEEEDSSDDYESCSDDSESEKDNKFEYVGEKPSKYELLMFTPCPRAVAVLASYPRSGNSLMRNLYEKITLRVTGSDMMGGLQKHDLVGEMATGTNKCTFVKTHYPERMGARPFPVSRAVLLTRNPYDAMDSYFNLMTTSSHTTSLTDEERKKYHLIFAEMAKREVLVWRDFHEFWLKQKIPLLVVRYEDLIRDTVKVIRKVIKFVLEINSMTFFEDRIRRAIGEEQVEKLGPYKARSGGIGRSLTKGHYTPNLLHEINHGIVGTMEKLGYKEMLVPNPKQWKNKPIDQHGVYIPGTSKEPMVVNREGLVRGPNRQTNWQMVQMAIARSKKEEEEKKKGVANKKLNLL